jgi:L-ascorbate metabolism protein UlaG (beta-lactamase superfamily)
MHPCLESCGPTALLEYAGLLCLTDPTFDPAGTEYPTAAYTLRKTQSPAIAPAQLGPIDAVLLSHDHHFDNLDHSGRSVLEAARATYTTTAGAERLGGRTRGLAPWESAVCSPPGAPPVKLTAVPARHGPVGGDRGPVLGFVLQEEQGRAVYVSGDTVWFEDLEPVGDRFPVAVAVLNMGAAKVAVAGPSPLTFTAADGVALARRWPTARIVPLHYEGWEHFTEGRREVEQAFAAAGMQARLHWPLPGVPTTLPLSA